MKRNYYLFVLLSCISLWTSAQPLSKTYEDPNEIIKSALQSYDLKLYGKAQSEFQKILKSNADLLNKSNAVPLYFQQASYYDAMCALKRNEPDAESKLLYFIQKFEPSTLVSKARIEIGHYYFVQKDYDKAIQFYSKISWKRLGDLKNEEVAKAKFELAYCYFVKKQFSQSLDLFGQIKTVKDSDTEAATYYHGLSAYFLKDYKTALEDFKSIDKSKKYDEVVPTYIVQIYFNQKKYTEVITYGEPLLKNNGQRERLSLVQAVGQSYYETENFRKALPYIEEFVEKTPKVTEDVFYQLAFTQYKAEKFDKAAQNFEQINDLNSLMGQHALYYQANSLLQLNKKEEARISYEKASNHNFDKDMALDALMSFAKLSYETGHDNEAISAFMKIPAATKYYNESQNLLSKLFLNTRDYEKALDILRKMPQRTPSLNETYQKVCYLRGLQLFNEQNLTRASELFDESLKIAVHNETTTLSHFWKGESMYGLEKYNESIDEYEKFILSSTATQRLPINSTKGSAYYGMGYAFLKMNDHRKAAQNFEMCIKYYEDKIDNISDPFITQVLYPDALIRTADCFLYLGSDSKENYNKASDYYERVVSFANSNEDYALYQLSLIYNILNKNNLQIKTTDQLVRKYPDSQFSDDALYAKGSTLINMNELNEAKQTFEKLINAYPSSEFISRSLYKLGVISYAKNQEREALDYFKSVVKNNLQSEEAKDALSYIRKIYVETGDADGFMAFVSTIQGYNFSDVEADSLLYETASRIYDEDKWQESAEAFTKYLNRFPNGMNSIASRNNRGICYYNLKDYVKSLEDFDYIINSKPTAPFLILENSLLLAARIQYHIQKKYADALLNYKQLYNLTQNSDFKSEALQLAMKSAFQTNNYTELGPLAEKYLLEPQITSSQKAEASFYLAKVNFQSKNFDLSKKYFEDLIKLIPDDIRASEGRYRIAQILYLQRNNEKSMEVAIQNNKLLGNHHDWLARNFILIADLYAEQGKLDAAIGTLESLLKNYAGNTEIVDEAKSKLNKYKEAKNSKSRLKRNNENGELEMINGND